MRRPRRTPEQAVLEAVPEAAFQQQLVEAARWLGYLVYHTYDSRFCEPGFPDLILVGTGAQLGRIIVAELKSERGSPTPAQLKWLGGFMANKGVEVYCWRPRDVDAAMEILQGKGERG